MFQTTKTNAARGPHNPFIQSSAGAWTQSESTQEAIVIDVIVNDDHDEYAQDGYNVGAVQFRFIKTNTYREEGTLNWALPLDATISDYPLKNEIVIIVSHLGRFYYHKKLNTSGKVTSHPLYGFNEELSAVGGATKTQDYRTSTAVPNRDDSVVKDTLGEYFVDRPTIKRLRHDEGDLIIEGRSGHSIRFGAAWSTGTNFQSTSEDQSPNLLFRVGPKTPQKTTQTSTAEPLVPLTVEDINDDATSVWMVTDQLVGLTFSTANSSIHAASVADFPKKLDGNQLVINTDRFIINTKKDKIIGNSFLGVHWTTLQNFTVDAGQDHLSQIGRNKIIKIGGFSELIVKIRHSIMSPKIYVGSQKDETEPLVCGALLAKFLSDFLDAHIQNAPKHVITPMGPGILSPQVLAALTQLKADVARGKYSSFNSGVAYTVKS